MNDLVRARIQVVDVRADSPYFLVVALGRIRMRSLFNWLTAAMALAVASGSLFAQPSNEDSTLGEVSAAGPGLSVAEMRAQSTSLAERVMLDVRHTMVLREKVRKQRDVIKLTCVNDKLIQMKARQNLFDAARQQLEVSLASSESGERTALFTTVSAEGDRIRALREEADVCVGEGELSSETSTVLVDSPEIPDDPTKIYPIDPGVEPPGYASPFR